MHHPIDRIAHTTTSHGALAGMRNYIHEYTVISEPDPLNVQTIGSSTVQSLSSPTSDTLSYILHCYFIAAVTPLVIYYTVISEPDPLNVQTIGSSTVQSLPSLTSDTLSYILHCYFIAAVTPLVIYYTVISEPDPLNVQTIGSSAVQSLPSPTSDTLSYILHCYFIAAVTPLVIYYTVISEPDPLNVQTIGSSSSSTVQSLPSPTSDILSYILHCYFRTRPAQCSDDWQQQQCGSKPAVADERAPQPVVRDLRGPGDGQALRRGQLRRLQGLLPPQRAQEPRLHLPLQPQLHRRQGQAQPVPLLSPQEVLQGRDEERR